MNYYEQFYDDLEFCEYDDDDPSQNAPGFCNNQYDYEDRQMCLGGPSLGRGFYPPEHTEHTLPYGNGHHGMRNEIPDFDNAHSHRGHVYEPNSGEVYRGRGGFDKMGGNEKQFRGKLFDKRGGRGNQGRGNNAGGSLRGRFAAVNFVKEGHSNIAGHNELQNSDDKHDNAMKPGNDTIRFDYKKFQNQKTETEKEVELALKAYSQQFPVGFGYGYGPRSDLFDGVPKEFVGTEEEPMQVTTICNSNDITNHNLAHSGQTIQATVVSTDSSIQCGQLQTKAASPVKKAMIKPAFNFVKAQSEFKSTDVAFHETENQSVFGQVQANTNTGNKRVGLGFSANHTKVSSQSVNSVLQVSSGIKHTCTSNQEMNQRFAGLSEAVKLKNLPGKNGIEILHMAIDKVKMTLNDQVQPNGRTATGQPMFVCKLEIDGVAIAQGLATAKKVAKHEAYSKAVKILLSQSVTVQEVSGGVLVLKSNDGDVKISKTADTSKVQQSIAASHSHTQNVSGNKQLSAVVVKGAAKPQTTTVTASYAIPKMTFHQAVHLKADKPLSFQKSETQTMMVHSMDAQQQQFTVSSAQSAAMKDPTAMAMKLLNVVKDGGIKNSLEISKQNEQMLVMAIEPERNHDRISHPSAGTNVNVNAVESPFHLAMGKKRPLDTTNIHAGHPKARRTAARSHNTLDDLSQFIIIDNTPIDSGINDMSILHISANFNKVLLKVEYEITNDGLKCSMVLSDHIIANVRGESREIAKQNATSEALKYLRDICYTIKVKQHVDTETGALTKEQLLSDIQKGGVEIPDSNIGNMLLRKMGWAGGGVGKVGQGIAEPVKAEMVIGREGLGLKAHKGIGKEFHGKVTKMLQDYLKSDEQKDFHFSSELSREERAVIHAIGQRMGLKTVSKGKDENRYLIVSRKRSAQELLEHVLGSGGTTSKYEVIPPAGMHFDIGVHEDFCHSQGKQ